MRELIFFGYDENVVAPFLASKGFSKVKKQNQSPSYESGDGGSRVDIYEPDFATAGCMTSSAPIRMIRFSNEADDGIIGELGEIIRKSMAGMSVA